MTKTYRLEQITTLSTTIDKAWAFFSDPENLAVITPPEMGFRIQSKSAESGIHAGMRIAYTVRPVANVPMKWISEITDVQNHKHFTDVQIEGPYKFWIHRHEFKSHQNGVLMTDVVEYQMPFGWFGIVAHSVFVRRRLKRIFDYRRKKIQFLFK
jgi:ligand-binding SRPBCC domain-containing protein